jgi:site-specific DNA-methyltransferase (adenine-specific)
VSDWTLHLDDCLDPVTGLASLADKSVDHVICDPPYEAEAHTLQRRVKRGKGAAGDFRVTTVEPLSFASITEAERDSVAAQFSRLARRWVIVFCQAEAIGAWRKSMAAAGLSWKRAGIWLKPNALPQLTGDRPGTGYESIAIAHAPGKSSWNGNGKHGVWKFGTNNGAGCDEHENRHPTQKPEALMESLVRDFTERGEIVLDPYAGSGTTGVACVRNGRRFIGWEKDPAFNAAASKRLAATREQLEMFRSAK